MPSTTEHFGLLHFIAPLTIYKMSVRTSWGCLKTASPDQHIFSLWCWHEFLTCPALLEEGSCIKNHLESARGSWGRAAARKFAERAGRLPCPLGDTAHSAQTQQGIGSLLSSQSGVPQVLLTRGSKPTLPQCKSLLRAYLCSYSVLISGRFKKKEIGSYYRS